MDGTLLYQLEGFVGLRAQAITQDAAQLGSANCPNFWIPKSAACSGLECVYHVEQLVCELYSLVMKDLLSSSFAGCEFWLQVCLFQTYEGGRGLAFHFDKDEHIMAERGEMHHPTYSSILYLTGSAAAPRQSPTVVLQQVFDSSAKELAPEDPTCCVLSLPLVGNFLVFDGALSHGVLDSVSDDVRMTLLINWWDHRPETIERITTADIEKYALSTWMPAPKELPSMTAHRISDIPQVLVTESADDAQSIDDLLEDAGITVSGDGAVHWVAIQHQGLALYSTADQLREAGVTANCAAAFVPLSLLAGSSGDDCEGEQRR